MLDTLDVPKKITSYPNLYRKNDKIKKFNGRITVPSIFMIFYQNKREILSMICGFWNFGGREDQKRFAGLRPKHSE